MQVRGSMTISNEPQIRAFRRQMRVVSGVVVAIGVVLGLPGAASHMLSNDWGKGVGYALWVLFMAFFGFVLYWFSRNYGVEERRLVGRFRQVSSPQATSPFSTSRGRFNTVRTRDGRVFERVYLRDGYVTRVGFRTRLPFDPKDVIEVEGPLQ